VRIWPVYKKELRLYFTTPLAWAILFVFMLVLVLPKAKRR